MMFKIVFWLFEWPLSICNEGNDVLDSGYHTHIMHFIYVLNWKFNFIQLELFYQNAIGFAFNSEILIVLPNNETFKDLI